MRSILIAVLLAVVGVPGAALADDPPTAAQLDQAKKAFAEGKKLHDAGKLPESIEKFKESYRLSKNPLLLYNIAITMEEAGMEDLALFYYRKYLTDAPADAAQRATVGERVKTLEKKFSPVAPADTAPAPAPVTEPKKEPAAAAVKPPGTYTEADFQHAAVDTAPPGKPLDVTAFVPQDSGFVVTLYFRAGGEPAFTAKPMRWRYKELVARVPAAKMTGTAVQYYVEAKDATGAVVARSGKSTSPNQVLLEADAAPRFYPDFTDETAPAKSAAQVRFADDADDPLTGKRAQPVEQPTGGTVDTGAPARSGSSRLRWGTTIGAGALLALGAFSYFQAGSYATTLEDDIVDCEGAQPPCHEFDDTAQGWQDTGKRYQLFARIGLGLGGAAAVVAGYFWYKELRGEKRPEPTGIVIAPTVGDGYTGAAAALRF